MPTFNDYWRRLTCATPRLSDPGATVRYTPEQLAKQLEKAYSQGAKDGMQLRDDLRDVTHLDGMPDPVDAFLDALGMRTRT